MPTCCVVGCGSHGMRDNVQFFRIPAVTNFQHRQDLNHLTLKRRQAWLSALRRQNYPVLKQINVRVCSKHFISGRPANLKDSCNPDWIPTLKMGYKSQQKAGGTSEMERYSRKEKHIEVKEEYKNQLHLSDFDVNVKMENTLSISREDFDQICRCCLKKGPLTSLQELEYEGVSFVEVFLKVFGEQIDFNDELPKCACEKCIGDIILCYSFKQTYEVSLTILATVMENSALGDSCATAEEEKNIEEILWIKDPKIVDPDDFTRNENTYYEEENVTLLNEKTDTSLDEEINEETLTILDLENEDITETVHERNIAKTYLGEQCSTNKTNTKNTCDICNKSFMQRETLQVHKRIHSLLTAAENENNASKIEEKFTILDLENEDMTETLHERSIAKTYMCEQCPGNKKYKDRFTLWKHRRSMHYTKNHSLLTAAENENNDSKIEEKSKSIPQLKTYSCEICSKTFIFQHQLFKHKREENHTAPAKIACEKCNKIISRKYKSNHMRICQSDEKKFVCEYCSMAFNIKKNLSRHIMRHTGERPHMCEICGKGFIQKTSLIEHRRSHTGEKPFLCDHCGKTFSVKSSYNNHLIKKHTDKLSSGEINIKKVQCVICNKFYSSKTVLRNHMTLHTGQKDFLCTHCGKNFSTRAALRSHSITHSDEKKFTCNLCGMNFRRYMSLKYHEYIHSEKRPFACNICSKVFRQKAHLRTHLRTHTGEKPYACPYCDKSFSYNATRIVHVRSHTGEKPYICDVCSKGFYDSRSMTKHRQTHFKNGAGIKFSKCDESK